MLLFIFSRKKLLAGIVEFSADYAWIQKKLLSDLDVPYVVTDQSGRLLWMNDLFTEMVREARGRNGSLIAMFPEVTKEILQGVDEKTSLHTEFGGRKYRMDLKLVPMEELEPYAAEPDESDGAKDGEENVGGGNAGSDRGLSL